MTRDPVLVLSREGCRALVRLWDDSSEYWRGLLDQRNPGADVLNALVDAAEAKRRDDE